jgi:hypothetical protein
MCTSDDSFNLKSTPDPYSSEVGESLASELSEIFG